MNETATTLLDCLAHWERVRPNAIYLTQPVSRGEEVENYSWREVGDQARRMAAHLASLNFPPRSQIALLGKNSAHWIMADLAIWMAGHVSVPLYPTANAETIRYVLEHSEARLLFIGKLDDFWSLVADGIPAELPRIRLPLAPALDCPQWDPIVAANQPMQPLQRGAEELATLIYTSGSTGRPKGVMIGFGAMMATARGLQRMFPIKPDDRMLSYLPLAHAAERAIVETPSLYFGCHVYFAWSLDTFLEDLRRARPTLFFSVPRLWTRFYQGICEKLSPAKQKILFRIPIVSAIVKKKILRQLGLEHVRAAITGSAPLTPALIDWYRQLGLDLLEGYAMSENFAYSHGNAPGDTKVGTVGRTSPGVECRIADNGEILVKSPGQMLGYYKLPEQTAESMTADGFFKTGDMGEIDGDGRLRITGRVKELFKTSKGKYVAPVPIENLLAEHPLIEAVCVTGVGQPQPVAVLMLNAEARKHSAEPAHAERLSGDLAQLLTQVNARLEAHEQLDYLVVAAEAWTMDNGFLTPTMKIRRNVIEKRYSPQLDQWSRKAQKIVWA